MATNLSKKKHELQSEIKLIQSDPNKSRSKLYNLAKDIYKFKNELIIVDITNIINKLNNNDGQIYSSLTLKLAIDNDTNSFNKHNFIHQFSHKFNLNKNRIKLQSVLSSSGMVKIDILIEITSHNHINHTTNLDIIKNMVSQQSKQKFVELNIFLIQYNKLMEANRSGNNEMNEKKRNDYLEEKNNISDTFSNSYQHNESDTPKECNYSVSYIPHEDKTKTEFKIETYQPHDSTHSLHHKNDKNIVNIPLDCEWDKQAWSGQEFFWGSFRFKKFRSCKGYFRILDYVTSEEKASIDQPGANAKAEKINGQELMKFLYFVHNPAIRKYLGYSSKQQWNKEHVIYIDEQKYTLQFFNGKGQGKVQALSILKHPLATPSSDKTMKPQKIYAIYFPKNNEAIKWRYWDNEHSEWRNYEWKNSDNNTATDDLQILEFEASFYANIITNFPSNTNKLFKKQKNESSIFDHCYQPRFSQLMKKISNDESREYCLRFESIINEDGKQKIKMDQIRLNGDYFERSVQRSFDLQRYTITMFSVTEVTDVTEQQSTIKYSVIYMPHGDKTKTNFYITPYRPQARINFLHDDKALVNIPLNNDWDEKAWGKQRFYWGSWRFKQVSSCKGYFKILDFADNEEEKAIQRKIKAKISTEHLRIFLYFVHNIKIRDYLGYKVKRPWNGKHIICIGQQKYTLQFFNGKRQGQVQALSILKHTNQSGKKPQKIHAIHFPSVNHGIQWRYWNQDQLQWQDYEWKNNNAKIKDELQILEFEASYHAYRSANFPWNNKLFRKQKSQTSIFDHCYVPRFSQLMKKYRNDKSREYCLRFTSTTTRDGKENIVIDQVRLNSDMYARSVMRLFDKSMRRMHSITPLLNSRSLIYKAEQVISPRTRTEKQRRKQFHRDLLAIDTGPNHKGMIKQLGFNGYGDHETKTEMTANEDYGIINMKIQINRGLSRYYEQCERYDYFGEDNDNKGKFTYWCDRFGFGVNEILYELTFSSTECMLCDKNGFDFDAFPFINREDEEIAKLNEEIRQQMIFSVLQDCKNNPDAYITPFVERVRSHSSAALTLPDTDIDGNECCQEEDIHQVCNHNNQSRPRLSLMLSVQPFISCEGAVPQPPHQSLPSINVTPTDQYMNQINKLEPHLVCVGFRCHSKFMVIWLNQFHYNQQFLYQLSSPYRLLNALKLLESPKLIKPLDAIELADVISAKIFNNNGNIITCPGHQQQNPTSPPPSNNNAQNNNNNNGNSRNNRYGRNNTNGGGSGNGNGNGNDGDGDDEKYNDANNSNDNNINLQDLLNLINQQNQKIKHYEQTIKQQGQMLQQQQLQITSLQMSHQQVFQSQQMQINSLQNVQQPLMQSNLQSFTLLSTAVRTMQDIEKFKDENQKLKSTLAQYQQQSSNKPMKKQSNTPSKIKLNEITQHYSKKDRKSVSSKKASTITKNNNQVHQPVPPKSIQRSSKSNKSPKKSNKKQQPPVSGNNDARKRDEYYSEPAPKIRAFGNMTIPNVFISAAKPRINKNFGRIKCHINHKSKDVGECNCDPLFSWLDVDIAMQFDDNTKSKNRKIRVFNSGFIDEKTEEEIFLVAEAICHHESKQDDENQPKPKPKNAWKMKKELFTRKMLMQRYNFNTNQLPNAVRDRATFINQLEQKEVIEQYLTDKTSLNELIKGTKWCKIKVFSQLNKKRRSTLFITQSELRSDLTDCSPRFIKPELMPVLLFQNKQYQIHFMIIVTIGRSNVGISMIYDSKDKKVKPTGIHCSKDMIYRLHQFVSLEHMDECQCLDNFHSSIDHLQVGNVDEDANKINALKKSNEKLKQDSRRIEKELTEKLQDLEIENGKLHQENKSLANELEDLKQQAVSISDSDNPISPPPPTPSTIQSSRTLSSTSSGTYILNDI